MAHLATKRFNYWNQLAVLAGFVGVGLIIGGAIASILPFFVKMNPGSTSGNSAAQLLDGLLKPENATLLRWITFITAFFMFFLPTVLYALVCHKKPFKSNKKALDVHTYLFSAPQVIMVDLIRY